MEYFVDLQKLEGLQRLEYFHVAIKLLNGHKNRLAQ